MQHIGIQIRIPIASISNPQHSARTAGIFNPVAQRLIFGEIYSDTAEAEEAEEEEETPDNRRLEELLNMDANIADTLVTYE